VQVLLEGTLPDREVRHQQALVRTSDATDQHRITPTAANLAGVPLRASLLAATDYKPLHDRLGGAERDLRRHLMSNLLPPSSLSFRRSGLEPAMQSDIAEPAL
jgi:hypothetical protein